MKYSRVLLQDAKENFLSFLAFSAALVYFFCMFVWPWISGAGDWDYVQGVWDRWQGLNVGMLAFVSSITVFNISRYNAEKQRQRDFLASKAFLPAALAELVSYFEASATVFRSAWGATNGRAPNFDLPNFPNEYKQVFVECIRHAEPKVGDYLSRILMWLQVHDARLESYVRRYGDHEWANPGRTELMAYFYRLGELQALVNKLFEFARNMGEFDDKPLEWEDFRNAYGELGIWADEIAIEGLMNLTEFTRQRLERKS